MYILFGFFVSISGSNWIRIRYWIGFRVGMSQIQIQKISGLKIKPKSKKLASVNSKFWIIAGLDFFVIPTHYWYNYLCFEKSLNC